MWGIEPHLAAWACFYTVCLLFMSQAWHSLNRAAMLPLHHIVISQNRDWDVLPYSDHNTHYRFVRAFVFSPWRVRVGLEPTTAAALRKLIPVMGYIRYPVSFQCSTNWATSLMQSPPTRLLCPTTVLCHSEHSRLTYITFLGTQCMRNWFAYTFGTGVFFLNRSPLRCLDRCGFATTHSTIHHVYLAPLNWDRRILQPSHGLIGSVESDCLPRIPFYHLMYLPCLNLI